MRQMEGMAQARTRACGRRRETRKVSSMPAIRGVRASVSALAASPPACCHGGSESESALRAIEADTVGRDAPGRSFSALAPAEGVTLANRFTKAAAMVQAGPRRAAKRSRIRSARAAGQLGEGKRDRSVTMPPFFPSQHPIARCFKQIFLRVAFLRQKR